MDINFNRKQRTPWKIFILHSLISTEEQQAIFQTVEDARKIILSTNIAESSITVPDVRYGKTFDAVNFSQKWRQLIFDFFI